MIDLADIAVNADGRAILVLPFWRLGAGEAALLTGPSGAGKSTLLYVISGLVRPDAGRVCIDDTDIGALSEPARDAFRAGRIGIVFQTLRLMRTLTVRDNLALALRLAKKPVDDARIGETLTRVGLGEKQHRRPQGLSVGEAQRAAIARAVVARPHLLLADEPTSALDDANAAAAIDLLQAEARACGATLVVASHDNRIRDRFTHFLELQRP